MSVTIVLPKRTSRPRLHRRDGTPTIHVVSSDTFLETVVDAWVHIPYAQTTFGTDLTDYLEHIAPASMRTWHQKLSDLGDRVFATSIKSRTTPHCIVHLPLLQGWDDIPTLEHTQRRFAELAEFVASRHIASLALYALPFPGLHGDPFVGFLSAVFRHQAVVLNVFDQSTLSLHS